MSSIDNLMKQIHANTVGTKLAMGDDDPKEGHPSDGFEDRANVPMGPEISESSADQEEEFGSAAAGATGKVNPEEDEPAEVGTELHHGGDDADSRLKPGEGVEDPGPDSDHPANTNNKAHKYASFSDPLELVEAMSQDCNDILAKLAADPSMLADPVRRPSKTAAAQSLESESFDDDSIVGRINGLLPTEEVKYAAVDKLTALYAPYVAAGTARATKVANYLYMLERDPKLASEMVGMPPEAMPADPAAGGALPPGADPAAGGMPPGMPPGMDPGMDPAAGGDPMGGGGGSELDQLAELIAQIAEEQGVPPEELALEVASMLSGEGGGGDPMGGGGDPMGGGMPPDMGAGGAPEGGGMDMPPEEAPVEEPKTASAPKSKLKPKPKTKTAAKDSSKVRHLAASLIQELSARQ